MKYDILEAFKKELYDTLSKNTAKKYYSSVVNLFKDMQFNSLDETNQEEIEKRMIQLKTKNEFSAAKNGLKRLYEFDNTLNLPDTEFFKEVSSHKRNYRKNKGECINLDTVKRKVNQISNQKLKLAYRLALVSGLRVSELAALQKEDLILQDGNIQVIIKNGKGGKSGKVDCMSDPYLYKQMQTYLSDAGTNTLFYSEAYMREKANDLGLEMHDFRRIFAITYKQKLMKQDSLTAVEANKAVQKSLRHSRYKTTKRYLYGKKLVLKK